MSRPARHVAALVLLARQFGLPVEEIGLVGGERLVIELTGHGATGAAEGRGSNVADALDVAVRDLLHAWDHGLERALGIVADMRLVAERVVHGDVSVEAGAAELDRDVDGMLQKRRWLLARGATP